jgi:hypothetical protein
VGPGAHDPTDVALDRRVLTVPRLPFPGRVLRDRVGVLGHGEEAVLLLTAPAVMSGNKLRWRVPKSISGPTREFASLRIVYEVLK